MENILTGFHAVEERLRRECENGGSAKRMRVLYDKAGPRVKKILAIAGDAGVACVKTAKEELDKKALALSELARDHRGVMLIVEGEERAQSNIVDFEQFVSSLADKETATVLLLDSITDPHNVGAIIRSADQFAADLVVLPNHRSGGGEESEVIARASAGAAAWVNVARVANLVRAAEVLKKAGFWIYGADARGERLDTISFAAKSAIVMGSEGSGIAHLLREKCDVIASIPTRGKLDSLNVSVAAGVLLYERARQMQL